MTDKPWQDRSTLKRLYSERGLNIQEVAERLGCSPATVYNWTTNFGLERAAHADANPWRDRETLEYLFYKKNYSRQEIADKFGVWKRTINRWLREYDLQPETPSLKFGRLTVASSGYVQFVDYNGPGDANHVQIHRLLALRDHSVEEVAGKHVHHKIPVPWLNYPENIEVMDESEHISIHHHTDPDN